VTRQAALVAQAEPRVAVPGGGDDPLHAQAAGAGGEVVVLLAEPLAGAEEGALDGWPAEAHDLADVLVAAPLELAQDEDLVVRVGQAAERAAQVVELLLDVNHGVGTRVAGDELAGVGRREPLAGVVGDLLGAPRAPVGVDAGVLGDLEDPRLEDDRALRLADAAQRGDEDLLGDVLGAPVVLDHAEDVAGHAALVALEEQLERPVVTAPHAADELMIARPFDRRALRERRLHTLHDHHRLCLTESPTSSAPIRRRRTVAFI
jgi:hypothetical protein